MRSLLGLCLLMLLSVTLLSQVRIWDGGAGTLEFSDPANWDPDGVPGSSEEALLNFGDTVEITSGTFHVKHLEMQSSTKLTVFEGAVLNIDGATLSGLEAIGSNSKVFNYGTINIDNSGFYGFVIYGTVTNGETGIININTTDFHGIEIATNDSLFNYGLITITNADNHGIFNSGSIYNYASGSIEIYSSGDNGFRNSSSDFFHNYGSLYIEDSQDENFANAGRTFNYAGGVITLHGGVKAALENVSKLYNYENALIYIDTVGVSYEGFGIENGFMDSLFNYGQITILGAADDGIYNNGHFENASSGVITIKDAGRNFPGYGIYTNSGRSFDNYGFVQIDGTSETGIYNNGTTTNHATGDIHIWNSGENGILNGSADKFYNSGLVDIFNVDEYGVRNFGTFRNLSDGNVNIKNSGINGYYNDSNDSTFNSGTMVIDSFGFRGIFIGGNGWFELDGGSIEVRKD